MSGAVRETPHVHTWEMGDGFWWNCACGAATQEPNAGRETPRSTTEESAVTAPQITPETCPERESHGKPFRYCHIKGCGWMEEAEPTPLQQLQDALTEADDPESWPETTSEDFREGYRAALRLAIVTVQPDRD